LENESGVGISMGDIGRRDSHTICEYSAVNQNSIAGIAVSDQRQADKGSRNSSAVH
jgi:hypothetical protein